VSEPALLETLTIRGASESRSSGRNAAVTAITGSTQGATQAGQLGHPGVGAVHQQPVEQVLGAGAVWCPVEQPQVLGGDPRRADLPAGVAGLEAGEQPAPGSVGQGAGAAAQHPADPVERVPGAAPVGEGLLLDAAADVVDAREPELHDVEGVEDPHRVGEGGAQGGGVAAERVQRGNGDPVSPLGRPFGDPLGENGSRPTEGHIQ